MKSISNDFITKIGLKLSKINFFLPQKKTRKFLEIVCSRVGMWHLEKNDQIWAN